MQDALFPDVPTVEIPNEDTSPPVVKFFYSFGRWGEAGVQEEMNVKFSRPAGDERIMAGDVIGPDLGRVEIIEPPDYTEIGIISRSRDPQSGIRAMYTQYNFRINCDVEGAPPSSTTDTERLSYDSGSVEIGDELPQVHPQLIEFTVGEVISRFDCPRENFDEITLRIQTWADNGAPAGTEGTPPEVQYIHIYHRVSSGDNGTTNGETDGNGVAPQAIANMEIHEYCGSSCDDCTPPTMIGVDAIYKGDIVSSTGDGTRRTSFDESSESHEPELIEGEEACYYRHQMYIVDDLEPGTWNFDVVNGSRHICNGEILVEGVNHIIFGVEGCDE